MNIPTLIISAVIAVIFFAIIFSEIQKRKKGKGTCSCGCSGCANSEFCHGKKA